MGSFTRAVLAIGLLAFATAACADLFGPGPAGDRLLLFFDDRIEELDLDSGEQWARLHFSELGPDSRELTVSRVGSDVVFGLHADGEESRLVRLDLCTMEVEWEMMIGSPTHPRVIDGISFRGGGVAGVSPGGEILYTGGVRPDGTRGMVAVDPGTRRPIAFSGPFFGIGLRWVPPSVEHPDGLAMVTGPREPGGTSFVFRLHPETLELTDSIPPGDVGLPLVLGWAAAPDGQSLYLSSRFTLMRYHPEWREIARSTGLQEPIARVVLSADGETIMVLDSGNRDFPSSGVVQLFDAHVRPIGEVDVSTPLGAEPHSASSTNFRYGILSTDGTTAYILSGSGATVLYGYQPPRVIVVDVAAREFVKVVDVQTAPYPDAEFPQLMTPPDCGSS